MRNPKCQFCGREYRVKPHRRKKTKFCSRKCCYESRKIYRRCLTCDKKFHVRMSEVERGRDKYCSVKCRNEGFKKRISLRCNNCGKTISKPPHKIRKTNFCCYECHRQYIKKDVDWKCKVCGISLEDAMKNMPVHLAYHYRWKRTNGKYLTCSHKCRAKLCKKGKMVECKTCGKQIYRRPSLLLKNNFCSRECMRKFHFNK